MTASTLKPAIQTPFLTVIPDRRPQQKVHTQIGHAKNAIIARDNWGRGIAQESAIYEWKDNDWRLLWLIPAGTRSHNMPWHKKDES